MEGQFTLFGASVVGLSHRSLGVNNQDSFRLGQIAINGREYRFGVVCDGMSRSRKKGRENHGADSEVSARLISMFVLTQIKKRLSEGIELTQIPVTLWSATCRYIQSQIELMEMDTEDAVDEFVRQFWLCTIMGFIQGPDITIVFFRGDGVIRLNGYTKAIDQGEAPNYLAYQVIPWSTPSQGLADPSFETWVVDTSNLSYLAICSDAWKSCSDLLNQVPGLLSYPKELQRRLFVLSEDDEIFTDDATLVGLIRKE